MDKLSQMRSAVQSDLTVGAESSFFDPTTIDLDINRAYRKIGAMFKWEETKDAKKTNAIINQEYYDYPQNWRPMSIFKLTVDDVDFGEPITFKDYQYEKENSLPSGFTRVWSNFGKKYFIYPIPTVTGDHNISIFGYKFVDLLDNDNDITIFSYSMPEVNEAIVLEASAILKNKGEIAQAKRVGIAIGSDLLSQEARSIVITAWSKISQENQRQQRTTPQFDVPDFFSSGISNSNTSRNNIGNF